MAELIAVNRVHALVPGPKDVGQTAIDKRPQGPRRGRRARPGQRHAVRHQEPPHTDLADYLYAGEDADWWAAELDREIPNEPVRREPRHRRPGRQQRAHRRTLAARRRS
jgi:hypothetical protein